MEYAKKFLRTLTSQLDLVENLHSRFGSLSFSASEFIDVARQSVDASRNDLNDKSLNELFSRCCQQELLIPVPRAENQYDLNPAVLDIIELVTDQQQLGLSASIKVKIDDLQRLTDLLGRGLQARDSYLVSRYTNQLDRRFRDVRRELEHNEQAILRIIEEAKNTSRDTPLKARYAQALDAWNHYVQPTADMLDIQGEYELTLKTIEHGLRDYIDQAHRSVGFEHATRLERLNLRLLDLRSGLRLSIERCSRLLEPIYRRFQKNSALTRGASRAIAEMRRKKFRYAASPNLVPLTGRTRPSLTDSQSALIAYLSELSVTSIPTLDIPESVNSSGVDPITFSDIEQAAKQYLPMDDCMTWLIDTYPQLDTRQLLEFLVRLTNESETLEGQVIDHHQCRYTTTSHYLTMQRRTLHQKTADVAASQQENIRQNR